MTTEILISLVEIIWMLTPVLARTSNIFAATPEWLRMPTPTMESLPIFSSASVSPKPMSARMPSITPCALATSGLSMVNDRSVAGVLEPWLMFCTIMSTLIAESASF